MVDNGIYKKSIRIATFDVGPGKILKPSAIFRYQQEVGEEYMLKAGMSYDYLRQKFGIIFVLSNAKAKVYRLPREHEEITVTTWCSGEDATKFRRCFRFETTNGELLIESVTLVPVIDVNSRRIVRPQRVKAFDNFKFNDSLSISFPDPRRVRMPEETTDCGDRIIRYSDLDYNSHTNNSVYADIITDFLPKEKEGAPIDEIEIYYRNEMKLGEKISICTAEKDGEYYVSGSTDGENKFVGKCILKK